MDIPDGARHCVTAQVNEAFRRLSCDTICDNRRSVVSQLYCLVQLPVTMVQIYFAVVLQPPYEYHTTTYYLLRLQNLQMIVAELFGSR